MGSAGDEALMSHAHGFELVETLSRSFLEASQRGEPPSIVEYLGKAKEAIQPALLRNLLQIDMERRRLNGEHPKPDDYLRWFPGHEALIRQEFLESISKHRSSRSMLAGETSDGANRSSHGIAARRLGDYHLIRELGRGGMGLVFEAVHVHRKEHVALKTLPELDGKRLHRFKREFRSLADINHPRLIGLHTLQCDGDQWFFTMDLIDGTDFTSFVRPHGELDERRLRSALLQLVTGVMALHGNHVVHRDLKSSNVMVDREGSVVLLDFGLILELDHDAEATASHRIIGTPAYMSPEQARGESGKPSCDWYAVGVMLYEALTGHLPFRGPVWQVLRDKQQQAAPPLADDAGLPPDLRQLCMRLLARDQSDRPDAMEITKSVAVPRLDARSSAPATGHRLIGRDEQLKALDQCLQAVEQSGEPLAIFVSGRSGEGKTTLCDAFLEPLLSQSGHTVLQGRCYDRESVPFKALDSTIDAVCGYLTTIPHGEVAGLLPRDISFLGRIFPVFHRVDAIAMAPQRQFGGVEDQEFRTRAFSALRELLRRIGTRQPIVMFIDDLHWGDADSAGILLQVLKPPRAPRVLLLATFRSDEAVDSPFLRNWEQLQHTLGLEVARRDVSVGPFSCEECMELAIEMLHQDSQVIRRRSQEFFNETGGNPVLLTELLGCFDPHTDSFRPLPVREVIDNKLDRLPPEARRILDVTAVSGQALDLAEAAAVAGHGVPPMPTLNRMRSERLIRFLGSDQARRIDTYHDRIRETVLAEIEPAAKRLLHGQLAEHIERQVGGLSEGQLSQLEDGGSDNAHQPIVLQRVFDLSFHFDAAGDSRRACAYALLAAEQARRQFALEVAEAQYKTAWKNAEKAAASTRRRISVGLGETLTLLARYDEAEPALAQAHALADDQLSRCEIEFLQGKLLIAESKYAGSAERYTEALRAMGVRVPRTAVGLSVGIVKEVLVQAMHTVARYPRAKGGSTDRRDLLVIDLLRELTLSVWFRSTPSIFWCHLASMNRAERLGPSRAVNDLYSCHAGICAPLGLSARGFRYADRALAAIEDDDLSAQLSNHFFRGVGLYSASRYEECKQAHARGLELIERTGDMWKAMIMRLHIALSEYRLGNLRAAMEETSDAFQMSVRLGDFNTAHDHLNLAAMLTAGAFAFDEMKATLIPIPDNYQATNQGLQAEARWHLHHGRTREGLEVARQAFDLAKKHLVINHITMPNVPLLLQAMRMRAEAIRTEDAAEANRLLKRGHRLARVGVRITAKFPDYPSTLRELGHYHALRGHLKKAIRATAKSCQVAEHQQASFELAQSRLANATYRYRLGVAGSTEVEEAEQSVARFEQTIREYRMAGGGQRAME